MKGFMEKVVDVLGGCIISKGRNQRRTLIAMDIIIIAKIYEV